MHPPNNELFLNCILAYESTKSKQMFRKYVRFLLTNTCSRNILKSQAEQLFGINVRFVKWGIDMKKQEIKNKINKRKERAIAKRRMILLLAAVLLITVGSVIFGSIFINEGSSVEAHDATYTAYKSIEIKAGDSLWSIAEEYMLDEFDNTAEYVKELKRLNNLTSDTIHEGQYLLVAYQQASL